MNYERPKLILFNDKDNQAKGASCEPGTSASPLCNIGVGAGGATGCNTGNTPVKCSFGNGV